jgi:hypothetical protein
MAHFLAAQRSPNHPGGRAPQAQRARGALAAPPIIAATVRFAGNGGKTRALGRMPGAVALQRMRAPHSGLERR